MRNLGTTKLFPLKNTPYGDIRRPSVALLPCEPAQLGHAPKQSRLVLFKSQLVGFMLLLGMFVERAPFDVTVPRINSLGSLLRQSSHTCSMYDHHYAESRLHHSVRSVVLVSFSRRKALVWYYTSNPISKFTLPALIARSEHRPCVPSTRSRPKFAEWL
ncbi:hypothetical protein HDV57DRAFT_302723 [Trichoderma longibrachiatum]